MSSNYFYETENVVLIQPVNSFFKGTPAYFLEYEDQFNVVIVVRDGRMFEKLDQCYCNSIRDYLELKQSRSLGKIRDWVKGMTVLIIPNSYITSQRIIEEQKVHEDLINYF